MKIYISGPITGIKNYEEKFEIIEGHLKDKGHEIINPCKLPHNHGKTHDEYLKEDLKALEKCDAIYMMRGWTKSTGCQKEFDVATKNQIYIFYFMAEVWNDD